MHLLQTHKEILLHIYSYNLHLLEFYLIT